ncbi:MAG: hypothetical protein SGBAC_001185 [Bacillariaceae sp.]
MATATGYVAEAEDEHRIAYTLAYNEVSMGSDGQVLTDDKKRKQREKKGYCLECRGPPVMLYTIKKSRMNPLFTTKKPRTVEGQCSNGFCFLCHPEKNPDVKKKNKFMRNKMAPIPVGGRRSIPIITSQILNQAQHRSPKPSPQVTPLSSPSSRRVSETASSQRRVSDPANNRLLSPLSASRRSVPMPVVPNIDLASTLSDDTGDSLTDNKPPSPTLPPSRDSEEPRQYVSDSVLPRMSIMDEPSRRPNTVSRGSEQGEPSCRRPSTSSRQSELSRQLERSSELSVSSRGSASSRPTNERLNETTRNGSDSFNDSFAESLSNPGRRDSAITATISEEDMQVIISELDSLLSELMKVPGAEEIVAQSLVSAIREHQTKEDVLIYCLRTIWESCKENDIMKREVMKMDVSRDIVNVMKKFSKSAVLQEVGCGATWALAIKAENRLGFIRRGSCAIIMAALDRFKTHENVVCSAVGAARTLSPEDDAREPLRVAEGSKMVAKAMRAHPTSSIIQRDGCAFLSNAAVDMKMQYVTVVSQEELQTVLQAIHNHRNDSSVVAGACFALKNYTVDENNCRTLRKIENSMDLIQHAAGFISSQACMEDAEDILESMQFAQTLDNSIEDEAYVTFSSSMEQQISLPGFVNRILEFMEENDWSVRLTSLGLQTYGRLVLSDSDHKDRVYSQTNLSRIVQFARNLKEEQSVCAEACNLLAILAAEESKRPILTSVGACDILFHSLSFQRNEALIRSCLQALELLASSNAGGCIMLIKQRKPAIREVLEANQTSDSIMMSAMTILSLVD